MLHGLLHVYSWGWREAENDGDAGVHPHGKPHGGGGDLFGSGRFFPGRFDADDVRAPSPAGQQRFRSRGIVQQSTPLKNLLFLSQALTSGRVCPTPIQYLKCCVSYLHPKLEPKIINSQILRCCGVLYDDMWTVSINIRIQKIVPMIVRLVTWGNPFSAVVVVIVAIFCEPLVVRAFVHYFCSRFFCMPFVVHAFMHYGGFDARHSNRKRHFSLLTGR